MKSVIRTINALLSLMIYILALLWGLSTIHNCYAMVQGPCPNLITNGTCPSTIGSEWVLVGSYLLPTLYTACATSTTQGCCQYSIQQGMCVYTNTQTGAMKQVQGFTAWKLMATYQNSICLNDSCVPTTPPSPPGTASAP